MKDLIEEHKESPTFLIVTENYAIGNTNVCVESRRTFDVSFNNLATNDELLTALNLVSMFVEKGREKAVKFFVGYMAAFEVREGLREYLETNPMIRLLVTDETVLEKVNEILTA